MSTRRTSKVRYGVVGLGHIAQTAVLPAFEHARENSELVALISSDAEKLRRLGKRHEVRFGGMYEELERVLIEAHADALYVAVPNALHREMTERAARIGVHVLCEKPMATTVPDCEAMIRATREGNVRLMIAYRLHFEEANLHAIERIREGEIGEPRVFTSVLSHQVPLGDIRTREDLGGGALFDLGVYCINAARYLFQAEPTEVLGDQTAGTEERFREVDEMTSALLRFPRNRMAQFTANQGAGDVSELRVVGTLGDIRLDPAFEYAGERREFLTIGGRTKETIYPRRDQFAPELVYFSNCILEGNEPEPSGEEGLADVRVMEAIERSARISRKVTLAPFERHERPSEALRMRKPPVRKVELINASPPSR